MPTVFHNLPPTFFRHRFSSSHRPIVIVSSRPPPPSLAVQQPSRPWLAHIPHLGIRHYLCMQRGEYVSRSVFRGGGLRVLWERLLGWKRGREGGGVGNVGIWGGGGDVGNMQGQLGG